MLSAGLCLPALAQTMMPGLEDNFAGPQDPALPSSELARVLDPRGGTQDFDLTAGLNGGSANTSVAHTFAELPHGILSASLELTIRASTASGIETDGIFLSFVESTTTDFADAVVWGRSFGAFVNPPATSPFTDSDPIGLLGGWTAGQQAKVILDLAALPLASGGTLNLIPWLNRYGFLDVIVGDETAVDYMKLSVVTPQHIPEPSAPALLALSATVLCLTARHRRDPRNLPGRSAG